MVGDYEGAISILDSLNCLPIRFDFGNIWENTFDILDPESYLSKFRRSLISNGQEHINEIPIYVFWKTIHLECLSLSLCKESPTSTMEDLSASKRESSKNSFFNICKRVALFLELTQQTDYEEIYHLLKSIIDIFPGQGQQLAMLYSWAIQHLSLDSKKRNSNNILLLMVSFLVNA